MLKCTQCGEQKDCLISSFGWICDACALDLQREAWKDLSKPANLDEGSGISKKEKR